jgi:NIMA (never in mitosis gene a)-related kinase
LGDLGVSKIIRNDAGLYSRVGTPLYLAPEIIKYEKYDYKADIWGLGCVVYQLAALCHPFEGKNIISLGQNIVSVNPKNIDNYSVELNSFIMDMLEKNPDKRLSAEELLKKYYKDRVEGQS